jgi:hypothetical protein
MKRSADQDSTGGLISPPVHLEFIKNQAALPDSLGLEEVEKYHRAIFMHHHARELERLEQESATETERVDFLSRRWHEIQARLQTLEKHVPVNCDGVADLKPSLPWNYWDRSMFITGLLGVAVLLIFGVLNISFNLLESGLVTFVENPLRAYFWAALLPVGALGVKVGWDLLPAGRWRDVYVWNCLVWGLLGVLVWVTTYAMVYPSLSKSLTDHLQTISVFDSTGVGGDSLLPAGARRVDMVLVFAQAVAEVFLSAVLGIYLTLIYNRHRPVRLAPDPLYAQLDAERIDLERQIGSGRQAIAAARGQRAQLENQLAALVAYARSMYQKEATERRDQYHQKEAVLDQLSEHLRTQLETLVGTARSNGAPALTLSNRNEK